MKYIILFPLLILLFLFSACKTAKNPHLPFTYTVSGIVEGSQNGDTLFLRAKLGAKILGQAIIKDSKFEFTGIADEYVMCRIQYKESPDISGGFWYQSVVLEDAPAFIQAKVDSSDNDFARGRIVNSGKQNHYQQQIRERFKPLIIELNESFAKWQEAGRASDQQEYQLLEEMRKQFYSAINKKAQQKMVEAKVSFVKENPDALWPLYSFYVERDHEKIGQAKTKEFLNMFEPKIKRNTLWKKLYERVMIDSLTQIGGMFRTFEAQAIEGGNFNFEKYKNQFVLLDFWASWCGPCRVAHPGLIKVYEQYKTKGFTVVSISLDETKEAWQKAVAKDELTWDQFSDLKFPSPIADMYGISSFPMNFLFDPCGKIIAKNLNPDQLKQKLKEVFK